MDSGPVQLRQVRLIVGTVRIFETMREGLRSHTRRTAEKEIDLNKDPVEDDGSSSKSPQSSVYFSTEEKAGDAGLDVDVSSNAAAGEVGEESGFGGGGIIGSDDEEISGEGDGDIGGSLPLTNEGVLRTGLEESGPLGKNINGATAKRGRKRKMVAPTRFSPAVNLEGAPLNDEDVFGNAVLGLPVVQDAVLGFPSCNPVTVNQGATESRPLEGDKDAPSTGLLDLNITTGVEMRGEGARKGQQGSMKNLVDSGLSVAQDLEVVSVMEEDIARVAQDEEDGNKHEILDHSHDVDEGGNMAVDLSGKTGEDAESSKGDRGRKRKVLESSGKVDADWKAKRLALGTPQIVGRVLRSRTRAANAAKEQACTEEKGLEDRKGEVSLENVDMDIEKNTVPAVNLKRGRGRPPKMHEKNLVLEIEENARPAVNLKRGRGRPPKMHGENGKSKVTGSIKANSGSSKKFTLRGAKVLKSHQALKLRKRKIKTTFLKARKENRIDKKEGDMRPKEQKQLLKDQIVEILMEAGWTIEHRPRNGREYLDAVYVDGQGRTHWSVTLAYKKLQQKVEDGTADGREISAFTPIPDDKLCKLFRVTKAAKKSEKGLKVGGIGNGGSKSRPDKRSSVSKTKASISGPQEGVTSEGKNAMGVSSKRNPNSRRGGGSRKPCGLMVRKSKDEFDKGKHTLLSWMIDLGTISPGEKVKYMIHERTDVTHGKITREGICCDCCGKIFSLVDFESHTGNLLGQPLQKICLESGKTLLQCMSESWRKQEEIDHIGFNFVNVENDPYDDTCNICADGGNLMCCDSCPSTFHQSCLQLQEFPTGDWHCIYCSCKFCGMVCWGNSLGENVLDPDYSGHLTCLFCEEKFHVNCMLKKEDKSILSEFPFCGSGCQKLFQNLQNLLGVKHELENGYSWSILRRQDLSCTTDSLKVESNAKLVIAHSIIDECFTPIIDERSNIDLIRSVCFSCGSNVRRLSYSGFCTFILEKNDELVSAATIRVHGNQLAEMPFIGTRAIHRRKGMCRRLLTAIEAVLSSLGVEKLVIPAVPELSETWTKVFGFLPLEESRRPEMKYMNLVVFPGSDMLQKPLCKHPFTDGETSAAGMNLSQLSNEHVNENTSPTNDTCGATVGSGLPLACDNSNQGPEKSTGLINSNTSKDILHHELDISEVKLETSKSGMSERNQVDKLLCT